MAETVQLTSETRPERGTRQARQLRKTGRVPAVLYGHKKDTLALSIPSEEAAWAIRHGARVVNLEVGGAVESALIADVQWDHLGKELVHVDFQRVSRDERIKIVVPIELRGTPTAVGGGILEQPLHTLHIECPATAVPESIRVAINELHVGMAIHVKELHLPEGVTVLDDPEAIVVQIKAPIAEAEAPAAPAGPAEPEVIGRKAEEEGEAE
jgi:large subunit ribosomal protein L25